MMKEEHKARVAWRTSERYMTIIHTWRDITIKKSIISIKEETKERKERKRNGSREGRDKGGGKARGRCLTV